MSINFARLLAVIGTCSMIISACGTMSSADFSKLPVEMVQADFAIDVSDPREVVGFADYYFIADVESAEPVKENGLSEAIKSESTGALPYTAIRATVLQNIKGTLPTDKPINFYKAGGVSTDGKTLMLYANDTLPEVGNIYAFTAVAQADGSLLVSGSNSNVQIDTDQKMIAGASFLSEYEENYKNEITYERERFSYKGEN